MLPKGIIEKINKFYFEEPQRKKTFEKAMTEFFEVKSVDDLIGKKITENSLGLANEWFVYDYRHENGKTTLENYLTAEAEGLTEDNRKRLEILSQTNYYGLFEVKKVFLDSGLEIYDLQNGKTLEVQERSATHTLKNGNVFPARLGQVDGHWEMVGADTAVFPINLQDGARNFFKNTKNTLSPKEIFKILNDDQIADGNGKIHIDDSGNLTPEETKKKLTELLSLYQIEQYASVETIADWCREASEKKRDPSEIISVVLSLVSDRLTHDELEKLISALVNFYNIRNEKYRSKNSNGGEPKSSEQKFIFNAAEINGQQFFNVVTEAHQLMEEDNFGAAVEKFEETFKILLEQKTTKPDVYRVYANAAVAYFGLGQETEGKILLNKALELNSNYDFALATKRRLENNELNGLMAAGRIKNFSQRWNLDDLRYNWTEQKIIKQLAKFGIKTDKKTFLELAKKYTATDELAEKEWFPIYTGPDDWNEDFVWMAAFALWEKWAKNLPALDILEDAFSILSNQPHENSEDADDWDDIEHSLEILAASAPNISPNFANAWKNSYHYENDVENFMNTAIEFLLEAEGQTFIGLADEFQKNTGDNFWGLTKILEKIIKKEPGWPNQLAAFAVEFPYSTLPLILTARIAAYFGDEKTEEEHLLRALKTIESADKLPREAKVGHDIVKITDEYDYVLNLIKKFYQEHKNGEQLKEINSRIKENEQRKKNESEEDKKISEEEEKEWLKKMEKLEQENRERAELKMQNSWALKYFSYLKNLGLNFQTAELTKSKIIVSGLGQKIKIGRNDPCPCSSGKKYKKCHGG